MSLKLRGLLAKADKRSFALKRTYTDGTTYQLKLDGMPSTFSPDDVSRLAEGTGGKVSVRVNVGKSVGQGGGTLGAAAAKEAADDLTMGEDDTGTVPAGGDGAE